VTRTLARALAILLLSILAVGTLLLGVGCGEGVPDNAVAKVGDELVTKAEFNKLMKQAKKQVTSSYGTFPEKGSSTYDRYVAQVVSYLVQNEVVAQGSKTLGVEVSDDDVDSYVEQMQSAYGGADTFTSLLEQAGMTMDDFRDSARTSLLQAAVASEVVKDVKVTKADVRAYWREHAAKYRQRASKKGRTATFANTKKKIRTKLLTAGKDKAWQEWLEKTSADLGVLYAAAYDPDTLTASPSPSASATE
jgi:hypothetical protein